MTETLSPRAFKRNFWLQLLGGNAYVVALLLGNVRVILVWVATHLGFAFFLIALLVPLLQVGVIASQFLIAPHIGRFAFRKPTVLAAGGGVTAILVAITITAEAAPRGLAEGLMVVCALGYGLVIAIFNVAYGDQLGKTIERSHRGRVISLQAALGGAVALAVVGVVQLVDHPLLSRHLALVWFSVAAWIIALFWFSALSEPPGKPKSAKITLVGAFFQVDLLRRHPWFRRLLMGRILMLSVELLVPFYVIHAATIHDPSVASFSAIVVAVSLGLFAGGPLWGFVVDRHAWLVATAAGVLAALGGATILLVDEILLAQVPYLHGAILFVIALARQGVNHSRKTIMLKLMPDAERPRFIATANGLMSIAGIAVAGVLGTVAQLHDLLTPLIILIGANLLAAGFVAIVWRNLDLHGDPNNTSEQP